MLRTEVGSQSWNIQLLKLWALMLFWVLSTRALESRGVNVTQIAMLSSIFPYWAFLMAAPGSPIAPLFSSGLYFRRCWWLLLWLQEWLRSSRLELESNTSLWRELRDFLAKVQTCGAPYQQWCAEMRQEFPALVSNSNPHCLRNNLPPLL